MSDRSVPTGPPGPGWYPNPEGTGLRWWNGQEWTAAQQEQPVTRRSGGWTVATVVAVVVVVSVVAALLMVMTVGSREVSTNYTSIEETLGE
jgi:hypothetical protein